MSILQRIIPYLIAGVSLVLLVCALVLLSWLFLWGAVVGGVLFLLLTLKQRFFPARNHSQSVNYRYNFGQKTTQDDATQTHKGRTDEPSGRIIECDDFEEKK